MRYLCSTESTESIDRCQDILNQTMNAPCCCFNNFFLFYATLYQHLNCSLMASALVFKFQADFFHNFVAQRFISSRAQPNGIFASARENQVVW